MHLDQQDVADLLPYLQQFVKTGELALDDTPSDDISISIAKRHVDDLIEFLQGELTADNDMLLIPSVLRTDRYEAVTALLSTIRTASDQG